MELVYNSTCLRQWRNELKVWIGQLQVVDWRFVLQMLPRKLPNVLRTRSKNMHGCVVGIGRWVDCNDLKSSDSWALTRVKNSQANSKTMHACWTCCRHREWTPLFPIWHFVPFHLFSSCSGGVGVPCLWRISKCQSESCKVMNNEWGTFQNSHPSCVPIELSYANFMELRLCPGKRGQLRKSVNKKCKVKDL